jgi:hypothetical protein
MGRQPKPNSAEAAALATLLGLPVDGVVLRQASEPVVGQVVSAGAHLFAMVNPRSSGVGAIVECVTAAKLLAKKIGKRAIPLVVVPFMSDVGRRACEDAGVSWFDLSGNGHILGPGLRVIIDGRPNRFLRPGRPASLFAPKSARVIRWLLMNPGKAITQREISRATNMTEGFVSRIATRLEQEAYIAREPSGALRLRNPELVLDVWRQEYQFAKHSLVEGHIAARSGDALARFLGNQMVEEGIEHAATGLAAAWQYNRFAAFRIATFFLKEPLSSAARDKLGFREEPRGANVWLVVPNDEGVFLGAAEQDGIVCVHPLQVYLDLKAHPERAVEAAERLRSEQLNWKQHG